MKEKTDDNAVTWKEYKKLYKNKEIHTQKDRIKKYGLYFENAEEVLEFAEIIRQEVIEEIEEELEIIKER